jgi:nucleotide-binding universal stress UspA family protein
VVNQEATMKTLVLVHEDPGLNTRVDAGLEIGRVAGSDITFVEVRIPIIIDLGDPSCGALVVEEEPRTEATRQARTLVLDSGLPFEWLERRGDLGWALRATGEGADLIVLSSLQNLCFPPMRATIGTSLIELKKAVLAMPAEAPPLNLQGDVLLLWDGSDQASRAIVAALPMIGHASHVTVLEIEDGTLRTTSEKPWAQLTEASIPHSILSVPTFGHSTENRIMDQIERLHPSLVVMGGFGHSRITERLFGGVTEHLLKHCPVPLFLKN